MGLDLSLLPFDHESPTLNFSHTILRCERQSDWFDVLLKLSIENVPSDFTSYLCRDDSDGCEEPHYGKTLTTPYGDPLTYTTAERIIEITKKSRVRKRLYQKNEAILAYLECLPKDTKVALYWD